MIKVCFIISGFAYSGAEIVLNRYLKNNTVIDPYFIILYNKLDIVDIFKEIYGIDKVYCLNIKHNKNILRLIPWIDINKVNLNIDKFINEIRPNVIYCNNTMETMLVSKYIKKSNIPSIAHIHDMKQSIRSKIRKNITLSSIGLYDKVVTVSNATKKQWNIDNMHVVYNGLEDTYFIDQNNNKYMDIKSIGFVGTVSKRKGLDLLLKSIDSIVDMGLSIHIAYSNIEDYKLYELLINKKNMYSENIKLYKNLKSEDMIKFYDNVDLIVTPSRQDPLPTVILESMARKTIVIGSNIDGIPEMIENKKLLIDTIDNKEIIKKIRYICNRDKYELQDIANEQYNNCKLKFSNSIKTKKINSLISSMVYEK